MVHFKLLINLFIKMNKPLLYFISLFSILNIIYTPLTLAQDIAAESHSTFNNIDSIKINADFCIVKLTKSNNNSVDFEAVIKSDQNKDQYKITSDASNGLLSIDIQKPSSWTSHWGEISLEIPDNLKIQIESQSGKVEVESVLVKDLDILSKSGHIKITDTKGNIKADSPAGDFIVNQFEGTLVAKSKTGMMILNNVNGSFNLNSNKGNFTINQLKGDLKTDGGAGSQELENIEGNISLKATSGDIKLSLAKGNITTRTFEGNQKIFQSEGVYNVQASTGGITGTRIKFTESSSFTTTEGNIKVQMNTKTDLAFVLKSENSFLRAMGKSKKKSLKEGKGSIVITGTSTTGSQAYY